MEVLGDWGLAVLVGVMSGTQWLKTELKKNGIVNKWLFMALPFILSFLGSAALVIGGRIIWAEVPLFVFIIGFGGNAIYKIWNRKAGLQ